MNELKSYFHIVPKDDGTTYLCCDKHTNNTYLCGKEKYANPDALVFNSEESANKWIKDHDINKKYKVEKFWSTANYTTLQN